MAAFDFIDKRLLKFGLYLFLIANFLIGFQRWAVYYSPSPLPLARSFNTLNQPLNYANVNVSISSPSESRPHLEKPVVVHSSLQGVLTTMIDEIPNLTTLLVDLTGDTDTDLVPLKLTERLFLHYHNSTHSHSPAISSSSSSSSSSCAASCATDNKEVFDVPHTHTLAHRHEAKSKFRLFWVGRLTSQPKISEAMQQVLQRHEEEKSLRLYDGVQPDPFHFFPLDMAAQPKPPRRKRRNHTVMLLTASTDVKRVFSAAAVVHAEYVVFPMAPGSSSLVPESHTCALPHLLLPPVGAWKEDDDNGDEGVGEVGMNADYERVLQHHSLRHVVAEHVTVRSHHTDRAVGESRVTMDWMVYQVK